MDDIYYMKLALSLAAEAAKEGEIPVGAVIVRNSDGFVAGKGRNTREKSRSALGHAEISAVSEACSVLGGWRLEGCTMYVTLEPCPMCAGAVMNSRMDRIVFGAHDARMGACGSVSDIFSLGFDSTTEICGGVMEDECIALLKDFFDGMRKKARAVRLTEIKTADQIKRAAALSGLSEESIGEEIALGRRCCFIRKKKRLLGYVSSEKGMIINKLIPQPSDRAVCEDIEELLFGEAEP